MRLGASLLERNRGLPRSSVLDLMCKSDLLEGKVVLSEQYKRKLVKDAQLLHAHGVEREDSLFAFIKDLEERNLQYKVLMVDGIVKSVVWHDKALPPPHPHPHPLKDFLCQ